MENKEEIIARLKLLLRVTRAGRGIVDLVLAQDGGNETVLILFENGVKKVDVTADSGIAIIKDVINSL